MLFLNMVMMAITKVVEIMAVKRKKNTIIISQKLKLSLNPINQTISITY